MDLKEAIDRQRKFFHTNKTKSLEFRQKALFRLEKGILENQEEIKKALYEDLHKSGYEAYMTEIGMCLSELAYVRKHLKGWMKRRYVRTPMSQFPAVSFQMEEPYGVVLVMAPWNYPFMLCIEPLIGAIAAGNCCVLKPSAYAPAVSRVLKKMITRLFPQEYIMVAEGGRAENQALLAQRFDYIFFTGSVAVGKEVMEKAAQNLTPVTLELGGKSPCIVDETADLKTAAKRLVFGKYLNSGQTCVAPDYLLVQESVKKELVGYIKKYISKMYGKNPLDNPDYPRMVNEKHFERVMGLIKGETLLAGGKARKESLQIAPTVLDNITGESRIMQEEIFGPVLPVLTFKKLEEAERFVKEREKPLALYYFTQDKEREKQVLNRLSFGGGCINDTIMHLASPYLGFGGVGKSGMGSYHGKNSFQTFSHTKSMIKRFRHPDIPIRYQPYNRVKEKCMELFLS